MDRVGSFKLGVLRRGQGAQRKRRMVRSHPLAQPQLRRRNQESRQQWRCLLWQSGDVLLEKGNFSLSEQNAFSPLTAGLASPPPLQTQLLAENSAGGREKPWTRDDCQFSLISRERFRVTEKHTKVAFKHRQLYTQHAPQQGLAPTDFRWAWKRWESPAHGEAEGITSICKCTLAGSSGLSKEGWRSTLCPHPRPLLPEA